MYTIKFDDIVRFTKIRVLGFFIDSIYYTFIIYIMLNIFLSKKVKYLLELIRFNNPIGFGLLMWPCCFALASLSINQLDLINWYAYFLIGSFTMRSVGCIINDIISCKWNQYH